MAERNDSERVVVVGKVYDFVLWLLPKAGEPAVPPARSLAGMHG
jgi:hypothetical protein